ncbi:MAG TPA: dihydrolipoamide succinyltransferase, partial [Hellea balneolensis]|nr:dihydrolipoamide succinyltransferase [Hellea balneolensis]
MTDIKVPNVGESVAEVTIAVWFKQVGEAVKKDEPLVELETDKAAQELVSPVDGVVEEILVGEGENAEIGTLIARIKDGAVADTPAKPDAPKAAEAPVQTPSPAKAGKPPMPSASRIIAEKGLDEKSISGTGKDGRITKGDA